MEKPYLAYDKLGSAERHSQTSSTLFPAALHVHKQVPSQHVGACSHRQHPTAVEPGPSTLLAGGQSGVRCFMSEQHSPWG